MAAAVTKLRSVQGPPGVGPWWSTEVSGGAGRHLRLDECPLPPRLRGPLTHTTMATKIYTQ